MMVGHTEGAPARVVIGIPMASPSCYGQGNTRLTASEWIAGIGVMHGSGITCFMSLFS